MDVSPASFLAECGATVSILRNEDTAVLCPRQESYSRIHHALISAYGNAWNNRYLCMFTIYMDDSGTAPEHKIAIASGIIFPALQIRNLQSEWDKFIHKEQIPDFHASECLARNPHSPFASWSDERVRRVFARIRQITFKYSVQGFCIAIYKKDYDELLTPDMKLAVGESHYSWAVSSVIGLARDWAFTHGVPMEYVFDTAEKSVKRELDDAMQFIESQYPGEFVGHYSFRNRKEVPALQATDLFAWTCFQAARKARVGHQPHPIAHESALAYYAAKGGQWWVVQSLNREGIEKWVAENRDNPRTQEIIAFKQKLKESRMPKRTKGI